MAFFGAVLERTKRSFSPSSASRSKLGFLIVLCCAAIASSLYGFLAGGELVLTLAFLLIGVGLMAEVAAVRSYAKRPTLAALLRVTAHLLVILYLALVVGHEFLYYP